MSAKDVKEKAGAEEKPKLTTVTLAKDHTHEGVELKAGATIDVNDADLEFLKQHEIIAAPAA